MKPEMRVSQALGLLEGTLGSPRDYTAGDYRRRIEMATSLLNGYNYSADLAAKDMQRQAFLDGRKENIRAEQVRDAFDALYKAYGFQGESGTEELMYCLQAAIEIAAEEVKRAHEEEACCTDCVSLMARLLDRVITETRKRAPAEQAKALARC